MKKSDLISAATPKTCLNQACKKIHLKVWTTVNRTSNLQMTNEPRLYIQSQEKWPSLIQSENTSKFGPGCFTKPPEMSLLPWCYVFCTYILTNAKKLSWPTNYYFPPTAELSWQKIHHNSSNNNHRINLMCALTTKFRTSTINYVSQIELPFEDSFAFLLLKKALLAVLQKNWVIGTRTN